MYKVNTNWNLENYGNGLSDNFKGIDLIKIPNIWKWPLNIVIERYIHLLLSGEPDYFGRNEISSGGDLSHYSSASLY